MLRADGRKGGSLHQAEERRAPWRAWWGQSPGEPEVGRPLDWWGVRFGFLWQAPLRSRDKNLGKLAAVGQGPIVTGLLVEAEVCLPPSPAHREQAASWAGPCRLWAIIPSSPLASPLSICAFSLSQVLAEPQYGIPQGSRGDSAETLPTPAQEGPCPGL